MYLRGFVNNIVNSCFKGKAILIYGMRQVGKTTLCEQVLNQLGKPYAYFNGDDYETINVFSKPSLIKLQSLLKGYEILFIDEAQRIPEVGIVIKLIVDKIKNIQVIATGSSSFELFSSINEPMTGRVYEYMLYPFSGYEMAENTSNLIEKQNFEKRLIYGSFPDIVANPKEAEKNIKSIANAYLFKDIFHLKDVKKPDFFPILLKKLAFRIGKEISYSSLANELEIDKTTISKYIDLLEKCFIIIRLSVLSHNPDKELKSVKKVYFTDLGIRNALVSNFKPIDSRDDIGQLFENYCIIERLKMNSYLERSPNYYFWHNKYHSEIDFIEEDGGEYKCFEMKWSPNRKVKLPETFAQNYKTSGLQVIHKDNYFDFIST